MLKHRAILTVAGAAMLSMAVACGGGQSTGGTGGQTGQGSGGSRATGGATGGAGPGTGGTTSGQGGSGTGGTLGSGGASGRGGSGGSGGSTGGSTGSTGGTGAGGTPGSGGTSGTGGGAASGHYYVSPAGTGTACTSSAPCSITQAQTTVRAATSGMSGDFVVELADGVYRLTAPLVFTAADSGANGHTITWQAASGAHPVLSGGAPVTGWTVSNSGKNIWKATAPSTFATRQLYVDGVLATRARSSSINRSDMSINGTGFTFTSSNLSFLNSLAHPERAELNVIGSWTNRYAPIQSVQNGTVTMRQPAWEQNTWGYDDIQAPYRQGPIYVENDMTLLDQPGEWFQDTTAGALYYIPRSGQDMTKVDVELPQLQVLLAIGAACPSAVTGGADCVPLTTTDQTKAVAYAAPAAGDPYAQPAHDLTFSGLTFAHTSWLAPNTDGLVDQQTGGFIAGPKSSYPEFEAARPRWHQIPAAVQVSAAKNIAFVRDRFVALGQVGLGIGNDANAHLSGVGLGASAVSVTGCVFSQIAGGAIVIGGVQAWAHHPCGDKTCGASDAGTRLIDQNITLKDNLIHDIGIDYRDFAGLMFTYTQNVVVTHNEIYNVPYSGIASGFGWGVNDAGGNNDYKTRSTGNLYKYQPLFTTGTVASNNTISANSIHQMQLQMNDGGCHYHLSANPGTMVTQNFCEGKGSGLSGVIWGEYEDEGSAYVTITKNVYANFGYYVTANANSSNNTGHLTFTNNWGSSASPGLNGPGNTVSGNIAITGDNFPADAQTIVSAAGLESAYADLKSTP